MSASAEPVVQAPVRGLGAERSAPGVVSATAWPRTRLLLPWLVAAYVVLVVLVPFDSAQLPIAAPIDTTLDRFMIGALVLSMLLLAGASTRGGPAPRKLGAIGATLAVVVLVSLASDVVNTTRLDLAGEIGVAVRRLAYLVGYALSFVVIAWSVRREDVDPFLRLLIGAGVVCAMGLVLQQRLGVNVFFDWTRSVVGGALLLDPTPVQRYVYSRPVITGPTQHGLAAASMLLMIAPFALREAFLATARRERFIFAAAFLVLVLGASSTLRRTSVLALLALLLVLAVYRRREMLRLLPFAIPAYLVAQIVAPGVGGNLRGQLLGENPNSEASTQGRTSDYAAIVPDVLNRPFLGRGFGTYLPEQYRVIDNQYLLLLLEIGVVGLLCFACFLWAVALGGHRLRRAPDPRTAWFGVAAVAAVAVFAVSGALFDVLSFPQPVYVLTLVAGLVVVVTAAPGPTGRG